MGRKGFTALLVVAAALLFASTATAGDFDTLIADINALPSQQNPQPLLAKALAAREAALRGQPCTAANQIGALRNQVAAKVGKKGIPDNTWGGIDGDALGVLIGLLTQPGSEACGGTGVAPTQGTEPTVTVGASDVHGLTLHVSFPPATFTPRLGNGVLYQDVSMDGLGSVGDLGNPNVPALTSFFAVPSGADVSVQVLGSTSLTINGIRLWPQQDEAADADNGSPFAAPPFLFNPKEYAVDAFLPASPAGAARLGTLRDLQVGGVETDGAQYNPVAQSLRVLTGMDVHVSFGGDNSGVFADSRLTSLWNLGYQRTYTSSILNYNVAAANTGGIARYLLCGEEYLIVTTHALKPAADTLAAARNADGISTRVVTLGSGEGDIGTTKEQIQTYIRNALNSSCLVRPSYVGILGNTAQVPTWTPASPWNPGGNGTGFDGNIASDLPYALADNADLLPDLAIGRMPAPDLTTANNEVAKIIGYEDGPPFSPADFYRHATVTSFFQCGFDQGGQPCNPGTQDERTFSKLSETVRNGLLGEGYTVDRVYTTSAVNPQKFYDGTSLPADLLKPGFAWNGTGTDLLNDWNAGRFLILHRDHGAPSGWSSPDFNTGNIPSLTNGALLPVVFSINCASGKFDDAGANFSEQLVEKASGGAVGVIGDSRNSPSNTNSHLARGLIDAIFPGTMPAYGSTTPILRMGDVLVAGKQYMQTQDGLDGQSDATTQAEQYLYHWFGDPTMPIWKHRPLLFVSKLASVAISDGILHAVLGDDSADGSVATLYQNGNAIGRALVKANGITITPDGPLCPQCGPLTLSLDNDGFVPTQLELSVVRPPTDQPPG